jgi:hypothetical protein
MGLCELVCKRDRLQEELNVLQGEMRMYQKLIEQKLQRIQQQQQTLSSSAPVTIAGWQEGAGVLQAASSGAPLPFSGYCLKQGTFVSERLVAGLSGLLAEAQAYYLELKSKGELLQSILAQPPQLLPGGLQGVAVAPHGGQQQQQLLPPIGRATQRQGAQGSRMSTVGTQRRGRGKRQRGGSSRYLGIGNAAVMREMFGDVVADTASE